MEIYVFLDGVKKSLTQLAAESGESYDTILRRYKAGVPADQLVPEKETGGGGGVNFEVDDTLTLEDGVLSVNRLPFLEAVYPVGAIYLSTLATDPGTLFGFGTWQRIQDRFLLAAGSTYAAGATGGEATHTLTVDEMPSHNHITEYSTDGGKTYATTTMGKDGSSIGNHYFGGSTSVTAFASFIVRVGYSGGSAAHNNMPPYLAVYVWQRTA